MKQCKGMLLTGSTPAPVPGDMLFHGHDVRHLLERASRVTEIDARTFIATLGQRQGLKAACRKRSRSARAG